MWVNLVTDSFPAIALGLEKPEKDIMEKLEIKIRPLVKELKYYFDDHTTISPKSSFIVFNIRELMNADQNSRLGIFQQF